MSITNVDQDDLHLRRHAVRTLLFVLRKIQDYGLPGIAATFQWDPQSHTVSVGKRTLRMTRAQELVDHARFFREVCRPVSCLSDEPLFADEYESHDEFRSAQQSFSNVMEHVCNICDELEHDATLHPEFITGLVELQDTVNQIVPVQVKTRLQ